MQQGKSINKRLKNLKDIFKNHQDLEPKEAKELTMTLLQMAYMVGNSEVARTGSCLGEITMHALRKAENLP